MRVLISTSGVEQWAKDMGKVVKSVVPKIELGMDGMASQDGVYLKKPVGRKVIAAFKVAGYKPFEQVDEFFVIQSKNDDNLGVTVDFRSEMTDDTTHCIIQFYAEE